MKPALIVIIIITATLACNASPPFTTSPAPAAPTIPPTLLDLSRRLADPDFKVRQAAQSQLDQITYRQLPALQQLVLTTPNEEAKSRLRIRIDDLTEQLASDPPLISLELKDATFDQTIKALATATGIPFVLPPSPNNSVNDDAAAGMTARKANDFGEGSGLFTLSAKDQPFWEVFTALSRQNGLALEAFPQLQIVRSKDAKYVVAGPLAVFPYSLYKSTYIDLLAEPGKQLRPPDLELRCVIKRDPRIHVVSFFEASFTEILDDAGNVLFKKATDSPRIHDSPDSPDSIWTFSQRLNIPDHPGKRIASAKGLARFIVQTAAERVIVADPEKKLNQPIMLAGRSFTITTFDINADHTHLVIAAEPLSNVRPDTLLSNVKLTIMDANNRTAQQSDAEKGVDNNIFDQFVLPLKLELSVTTRTKEVTIPFELKDLPLP